MIKLVLNIVLISVAVFLLLNIISYEILSSPTLSDKFKIYSIGTEVYNSINSSKKNYQNKRTVVLGDSVARQIITEGTNNKINIIDLTCNQAISLAGHYSLLLNVHKANPQINRVYLLYSIGSFRNNINQPWTFNYFIKPFYIDNEYIFSCKTKEIVRTKPYWTLYSLPIAKVLPAFGNIDYSRKYVGKRKIMQLSETSIEYLEKMRDYCTKNGIEFRIYPTPVSTRNFEAYDLLRDQIRLLDFGGIFADYFEKLIVLNNDFYINDNVHIKPKYIDMVSDIALNYNGLLDRIRD